LAAFLAQKRDDRWRPTSSCEDLSSPGNQADVIGAASGKTSPDGGAVLALVIIILACTAILVGTHATE
jgi:hypothetical protein